MLDTESRHSSVFNQGPSTDLWLTTMDWTLGTDQSLQDMLDCDIKSEIDSVIGGHPELGFNFTELSPLELDNDPAGCQSDHNGWFGSQSLINCNSNSSNSNFNLDLSSSDAAAMMVNPNSVMPHVSKNSPLLNNTISNKKRFLTFSLKSDTKENRLKCMNLKNKCATPIDLEETAFVEHESDLDLMYNNDVTESEEEESDEEESKLCLKNDSALKVNPVCNKAKTTLLLTTNSIKSIPPQLLKTQQQQVCKVNGITGFRLQNFKILQNSGQVQQIKRQILNNVQTQVFAQQQQLTQQKNLQQNSQLISLSPTSICSNGIKKEKDPLAPDCVKKPYPKPAYSYSCLIAMALKNSQTGSLPVSEIYNFMCEHFPYFKTAPNGWKNSVRHNLSLNKCFEKIEKPAGNGNQRKGCLWAINPSKITKMDEEVQKWSRKDPLAIKKAMIYPDHLELLERGEMKYNGNGSNDDLFEETESSADEAEGLDETSDLQDSKCNRGHIHSHLAANSVTDSYDESSQDCDDINEQLYDEIDIEEDNKESLRMQLDMASQSSPNLEYQINTKRQKILSDSLQSDYVYQPIIATRRKNPLVLTTGATSGSFIKIE